MDWVTLNMYFYYSVQAKLLYSEGNWDVDSRTQNAISNKYAQSRMGTMNDTSFTDPMPDILWSFNHLMLRCAVKAATWSNVTRLLDDGVSPEQSVPAQVTQLAFHSDLRWFAGAATLQIAAIVFILPMFWGFWRMSSDTSLSPLNTALAFGSPLLRDVDSQDGAKGVVKEVGNMKVRFGHIIDDTSPAESEEEEDRAARPRLGFAEARDVLTPTLKEKHLT